MKKLILLVIIGLLGLFGAQAQDSLAHYKLVQLDSIYQKNKEAKKRTQLLPYALAALEKATKELDTKDTTYAKYLFRLAYSYESISKYDSALVYYQKAVDIEKVKIPRHKNYAHSITSLGLLYETMGNYAAAEPLLLQALAIRKETLGENHLDYALGLSHLASLYELMGNYTNAEPLYLQAMEIRKKLLGVEHEAYAASLNNLASFYMQLGDYTTAEPWLLQASDIFKKTLGEQHPYYASSIYNLAIIYSLTGNYVAAEPLLVRVVDIQKKTLGEKHPNYANALTSLANLYDYMGNYKAAQPLRLDALSIQKEVLGEKHPDYAISLNNLASSYRAQGDYAAAEPLFLQVLAIYKETLGEQHLEYISIISHLANLYHYMGRYSPAKNMYQQALAAHEKILGSNHPNYLNNLSNLALLYQSIANFDSAQYCHTKYFLPTLDFLEKQGAILGEDARQQFFKTTYNYINNFNSFAASPQLQHDSLLAMVQDGLLLTKGYALAGVSELLPIVKMLNDSSLNVVYNAWTETKAQLGKAYAMGVAERKEQGISIDSLQGAANEQESALMRGAAALKDRLGYNKKRFYYKDLQNNIQSNELVVDFVRITNEKKDTAFYCALINQKGWKYPQSVRLCTEAQLEPYANATINLDRESYITQNSQNKRLYKLLIQPLEPYLKNKKRIHWAPVALMNQLAMNTLQNNKGKMLGERFELHQYGSLKDFIIKKQLSTSNSFGNTNPNPQKNPSNPKNPKNPSRGGIGHTSNKNPSTLLVGNIAFDLNETEHKKLAQSAIDIELYATRAIPNDSTTRHASRFTRLVGTKTEIENIGNAFSAKKWTIEKLEDSEAIEEKVCEYTGNKTPLVLHFATHGFFIPTPQQGEDNPLLRSGIALAGANRVWLGKKQIEGVEDGLWTAYEIANLDLHNAELVVLSACETARGQIDQNEGVLGLQRAFKIAGVDNMLLSLWQIPDKETVELMQAFYKFYLSGETPAVSLRKAQAVLQKKYPAPYYWAAFVLIE